MTYIYKGTAQTWLPLKSHDVLLLPGRTVNLPDDIDVVRTLAAKGLLVPVEPEPPGAAPAEGDIPHDPPSKGGRRNKQSANAQGD